jgi:hypothetical protein
VAAEEVKEAKTHPIGSNARIVSPYKFSAGAQSAGFMGSAEAAIKAPSKEAAARSGGVCYQSGESRPSSPQKWEPPLVRNTQNRSNQKILFPTCSVAGLLSITEIFTLNIPQIRKFLLKLSKDPAAYLAKESLLTCSMNLSRPKLCSTSVKLLI